MVAVYIGTSAELIKTAPVMRELMAHGEVPTIWWTGMHGPLDTSLLAANELADVPIRGLHSARRNTAVHRPIAAVAWVGETLTAATRYRRRLRDDLATGPEERPLLLVHGDTFSTVLGAEVGRRMHATVGHVEAGLRSGSLRHPFPEEANRRIVGHRADLHFAPGTIAVGNLAGSRGLVVDTGANTAIDALRFSLAETPITRGARGLVTLHRFELMSNDDLMRDTLVLLRAHSRHHPMDFYAGASDLAALERAGLLDTFDDQLRLQRKLSHAAFVRRLADAAFVVTDSGGLQQECSYTGVPTLIQRQFTESFEGVGDNIVLSGFSAASWAEFFRDPHRYRRPPRLDAFHPSRLIVQVLAQAGYLRR